MTKPGGFTAGDVLAAADMNGLPAGVIDYKERTTNQTGITTVADLTGLSISFTAVANRRYRVTGDVGGGFTSTSDVFLLYITDGSNNVKQKSSNSFISSEVRRTFVSIVLVPGAGSVTYKLRGESTFGNACQVSASATAPAFFIVEDIGPS
jgi:hypothetical protein